jgi:hypothetical protein
MYGGVIGDGAANAGADLDVSRRDRLSLGRGDASACQKHGHEVAGIAHLDLPPDNAQTTFYQPHDRRPR